MENSYSQCDAMNVNSEVPQPNKFRYFLYLGYQWNVWGAKLKSPTWLFGVINRCVGLYVVMYYIVLTFQKTLHLYTLEQAGVRGSSPGHLGVGGQGGHHPLHLGVGGQDQGLCYDYTI